MADRLRLAVGLVRLARFAGLAGLVSLVGCRQAGTASAPPDPPSRAAAAPHSAADLPSCRARWGDSAVGEYSFERDARPGERGNLGYQDYAARAERSRCRKAWTVLIYMAADNEDLPLHAYWNLDDIETTAGAASTPEHDVVVHLDLEGPSGLRRLHLFGDPNAKPVRSAADLEGATPARIRSPIVDLSADESLAPAAQLEEFVRWGMAHYPAEHTAIVVWGHGQGWRPAGPEAKAVRYEEREGRDLGVTLHRLDQLMVAELARSEDSATTATLRRQLTALRDALASTLLASAAGSIYDEARFDGFAGLALWLPRSADELALRLGDMASAPTFAGPRGPTAWRRWLEQLYAPPAEL